ncbi:hypothetical protein [Gulosibacter sp. 10]|uniref:hypothetical protein n=1 Tax=Gulosibacter sp. 10 TaxID=1255570 RepID=UPI00097F1A30|nr:hypothetical protein [Gulosibacter sp. 10]SJM58020.1 hypothetical protein FM112_05600 [Gulosibacter sp. 10]
MGRGRRGSCAAAASAVAALALSGCSAPGASEAVNPDAPEALVAVAWAEHLCSGEYSAANDLASGELTAAHDLVSGEHRIDDDWYSSPERDLASAEALAAARLEELREQGVDVDPAVAVDAVEYDESGDGAVVSLSGQCYGEAFSQEVAAVREDGQWRIRRAPINWQPEQYPGLVPEIPGGQYFAVEGFPEAGGWILPPGTHAVTVPKHFLTAEALEYTVVADPFIVEGDFPEVEPSSARIDDAVAALAAECGRICTVLDGNGLRLEVEPLQVAADGSATFTGHVQILSIGEGGVEWGELRPEGWGGDRHGDTGWAVPERSTIAIAWRFCPEGRECRVDVLDHAGAGDDIERVRFVELDGVEVVVSGIDHDEDPG